MCLSIKNIFRDKEKTIETMGKMKKKFSSFAKIRKISALKIFFFSNDEMRGRNSMIDFEFNLKAAILSIQ